jgi:hypothetical protein
MYVLPLLGSSAWTLKTDEKFFPGPFAYMLSRSSGVMDGQSEIYKDKAGNKSWLHQPSWVEYPQNPGLVTELTANRALPLAKPSDHDCDKLFSF